VLPHIPYKLDVRGPTSKGNRWTEGKNERDRNLGRREREGGVAASGGEGEANGRGRGTERGRKRGKGEGESWNRAAEWLRPALLGLFVQSRKLLNACSKTAFT